MKRILVIAIVTLLSTAFLFSCSESRPSNAEKEKMIALFSTMLIGIGEEATKEEISIVVDKLAAGLSMEYFEKYNKHLEKTIKIIEESKSENKQGKRWRTPAEVRDFQRFTATLISALGMFDNPERMSLW